MVLDPSATKPSSDGFLILGFPFFLLARVHLYILFRLVFYYPPQFYPPAAAAINTESKVNVTTHPVSLFFFYFHRSFARTQFRFFFFLLFPSVCCGRRGQERASLLYSASSSSSSISPDRTDFEITDRPAVERNLSWPEVVSTAVFFFPSVRPSQ